MAWTLRFLCFFPSQRLVMHFSLRCYAYDIKYTKLQHIVLQVSTMTPYDWYLLTGMLFSAHRHTTFRSANQLSFPASELSLFPFLFVIASSRLGNRCNCGIMASPCVMSSSTLLPSCVRKAASMSCLMSGSGGMRGASRSSTNTLSLPLCIPSDC